MKTISFVIPCLNEKGNIYNIYLEIKKHFKNSTYNIELIFINDGSTDSTLIEMKKLLNNKNIKIIILDLYKNYGKGSAMMCALNYTTGDYIIFIDADLQHPILVAKEMVNILEKNDSIDSVVALSKKHNNFLINIGSKFFYKFVNYFSDVKLKENISDF